MRQQQNRSSDQIKQDIGLPKLRTPRCALDRLRLSVVTCKRAQELSS